MENKKLKVMKIRLKQFILGENTENTHGTLQQFTQKNITGKKHIVEGARKQRTY